MNYLHPNSLQFALLLYSRGCQPTADFEADTADSIAIINEGKSDEAKADLYARIVEKWGRSDRKFFVDMHKIVSEAMWENDREFPRG